MKRFILSLFVLFITMPIIAQIEVSLTQEANFYRGEDWLNRQEIDYINPGSRGFEQAWTMPRITDNCRDCVCSIRVSDDTVAIYEQNGIHHLMLKGDTLFETAVQGRRFYSLLEQKKPIIKYPFHYGDSISGSYSSYGRDEFLGITITGWGYSVIDGHGILTDGVDTLHNIIRLKRYDQFTILDSSQEESSFQSTRYLWYCLGYRYPVLESCITNALYNSEYYPIDSISLLYLPEMQADLSYDIINDSIQKEMDSFSRYCQNSNEETFRSVVSAVNAVLSSDGSIVNITYVLEKQCPLDFCACDITGNILANIHFDSQSTGICTKELVLSRVPFGRTLMLYIKCGDEIKSIKVYE